MSVDSVSFRHAAGRFATGVTVVTAPGGEDLYAKTVSAFGSLSLDPALVFVAIGAGSPLIDAAVTSGCFAISVLRHEQLPLSDHFAVPGTVRRRAGAMPVDTVTALTGAPILSDCLSWFDCRFADQIEAGDHRVLVGAVVAVGGRDGTPLIRQSGGYRTLAP